MRENDFLSWIAHQTPSHPHVPLNVGDDMAAVQMPAGDLALLKIDQCLDQVHFDLRRQSPAQAGRKAVNRCLSDCAAMACHPAAILLSVALPRQGPGSGTQAAQEIFLACQQAASVFDCPVVGGDTSIWDHPLAITVAALGILPTNSRMILRGGAQIGDTLFVSGHLGGSLQNGRHLTFTPRIDLALKLAKVAGSEGGALHAMMDLSDGLAQDLPRLCAASHVGADIHTAQLPIHPDAHALAEQDHIPAGLHALADGEDYELLFALDPNAVPDIIGISDIPLTAIGIVTPANLRLLDPAGNPHPWPRAGWEHHA